VSGGGATIGGTNAGDAAPAGGNGSYVWSELSACSLMYQSVERIQNSTGML